MANMHGELQQVNCPLCGNDSTETIIHEQDYYNGHGLCVVRCLGCGLAYTNPCLIHQENLYTNSTSPNIEKNKRTERLVISTAGYRVKKITRLAGCIGRLLDVGCGDCVFLEEAASSGWNTVGIDLSPGSEQVLKEILGLDIRTGTIEGLDPSNEAFDVITAWDVLEHVNDPISFLTHAYNLLVPGGMIVLRVPNLDAYRVFMPGWKRAADRMLRRKRREYDTMTHIIHFDTLSLSKMVKICGFESVDLTPDHDYAFSRPKNSLAAFYRSRRMSFCRVHYAKTGINLLPELVIYARKPVQ